MNGEPYIDPAHRVPDDRWAKVVQDARKFRAESDEPEFEELEVDQDGGTGS